MKPLYILATALWLSVLVACTRADSPLLQHTEAEGFVAVQGDHFAIGDSVWFPLMVNYCVSLRIDGTDTAVAPAVYYTGGNIDDHFAAIAQWGFNCVRICADTIEFANLGPAVASSFREVATLAEKHGLRLMILLRTPYKPDQERHIALLLDTLAQCSTVWAYDMLNEPLYFDPDRNRTKRSALRLATRWRQLIDRHAPHQLFTIGLAEPIEVFEWDASLLPVDFVQMHTFNPLRVASEMWWYGHYVGRPWMVGETGLPADGDSIPLGWQATFMRETYAQAVGCGAAGYGWWEFQDFHDGVNFEAQYSGLRRADGTDKPVATEVKHLCTIAPAEPLTLPVNYYNMLIYRNMAICGRVTDRQGRPIEGATVRGWNADWSVGMNTYTDSEGYYTLCCNDLCVHYEVSAPGYSRVKFNATPRFDSPNIDPATMLDRDREYQSIDYRPYIADTTSMLTLVPSAADIPTVTAQVSPTRLKKM